MAARTAKALTESYTVPFLVRAPGKSLSFALERHSSITDASPLPTSFVNDDSRWSTESEGRSAGDNQDWKPHENP